MSFLKDTWFLFLHHLRTTMRMPIWVAMAIFQPVLWLLVFGQLFRAMARIPGFEMASYQQFLAPGLTIMSAIMGSSYSGMGILNDVNSGMMDRYLASPVRRAAILLARVLQSSVTVMVQSLVILGIAWVFSVRPPGGLLGVVVVMLAAALLGAGASAASNGLALMIRRAEVLVATINFLLLPAVFMSSMMISAELMPGWIRKIAVLNPINWGVELARGGFEGQSWRALVMPVVLLAVCGGVAWGVALRAFDRYRATL